MSVWSVVIPFFHFWYWSFLSFLVCLEVYGFYYTCQWASFWVFFIGFLVLISLILYYFLLPAALHLFCSFSWFLRWKFRFLIWDFHFSAVSFPLSTTLAASKSFVVFSFSCSSLRFLNFPWLSLRPTDCSEMFFFIFVWLEVFLVCLVFFSFCYLFWCDSIMVRKHTLYGLNCFKFVEVSFMAHSLAYMYQVQLEGMCTLSLTGVLYKHQFDSVDLRCSVLFYPCWFSVQWVSW